MRSTRPSTHTGFAPSVGTVTARQGGVMDLPDLLNEREWRRCKNGPNGDSLLEGFVYFCEHYWHIKHPARGRIKFELRDAQVETVRSWLGERYTVVLKARQLGFSTLAGAYAFWLAFFWPDRFIVMLSRTERESVKLLAKTKYGHKFLPLWLKQMGPEQTNDHQQKMVFDNESAIESLPSGNDPARGETVYLVIVDEIGFLPNAEEAWASIEPIAEIGGRIIALSTANGSGNFFHQLWLGSQTGANLFVGIFWPWSAGDHDEAWYAIKARTTPAWRLHQEYPRTPEEAFIKSGNPVFDIEVLQNMDVVAPLEGFLRVETKRDVIFMEGDDGNLLIWSPPEDGKAYVIGADVAEGLGHGDYSACHVIEATSMKVVAHWHGRIDPDLFGELLAELGWWYNSCLVGVESNNHGLTTLKAMQRYGYQNIYRQRALNKIGATPQMTLGWRTTVASKPLAIDELAMSIREKTLGLMCARTIAELKTFVRAATGRMHGSPHDDRVMALAIAHQMLKYVWLTEYKPKMAPPKFSGAWFSNLLDADRHGLKKVPIGSHNYRNR